MPQTITTIVRSKSNAGPIARLGRMFSAVRSYTLNNLLASDPKTAAILGFGSRSDAGIVVNAITAFTFSAVFDAVNQGSSDVAKLPLNLLARSSDGGTEHLDRDPSYALLKYAPNDEMDSMEFRRTLQAHAMTMRGGFAEIERDGAGRPYALWPITPDRVERKRDELKNGRYGPLYYLIDGRDRIEARDMIDIHGLGYDGNCGYGVIDKARQAIGLALAAEKFGATFFSEGAAFPGLLGLKASIGPDALKKLGENIRENDGRSSWHKFLLLDNDPSFTSFGVEPQKAQMNELRTKQVEEVARFFNFPVHKLKNLDRATNNNIEQQDLEYYKGFMLNWTVKWEHELTRKLVAKQDRGRVFFKHNFNAFLRADMAARSDLYATLLDRGVINADMVLELEDLNPQPNGLGKRFYLNAAMVPKDGTPAPQGGRAIDGKISNVAGAAGVISAHRALVADIMRRMLDREIDRGQRNATTEAKAREWLETFYSGHQDLMRTALQPAVRIHLAWIGKDDTAADSMALRLATAHIEESVRAVRSVLDAHPESCSEALAQLFQQWQQTRATQIADELMKEELEYARS